MQLISLDLSNFFKYTLERSLLEIQNPARDVFLIKEMFGKIADSKNKHKRKQKDGIKNYGRKNIF